MSSKDIVCSEISYKTTTLLITANYLLQALRFRARFCINATHHDPSLKKAHEAIYH